MSHTSTRPQADTNLFVYIAAAISALGGMLFGYDTGVISGAWCLKQKDGASKTSRPIGARVGIRVKWGTRNQRELEEYHE
ncbi:MAG: hypothetical protein M0024_11855 [Nitrospiraceae bacterium]|nr:hypothetical protein [Nitrospiraceae bacterium]